MDIKMKRRAELVKAMETVARCINDEDIFMGWLACGVADGDITSETTLEEIDEMGYTDSDTLVGLMDCFLRCMRRASKSGGIWCDLKTVSTEGNREEE